MTLAGLAWRSVQGNAFRSGVVFLCALLVAGLSLAAVLVLHGARASLRLALDRLGADVIVVPAGAEARIETALLMGRPVQAWMPETNLAAVARVPGVAAASPQRYLSSLANASCCSLSEVFIVAFDPATDFTVTPWLPRALGGALERGDAVGGARVHLPDGEDRIRLYGYPVRLAANLSPTGTGLDQTIFLTFQTAREVAWASRWAEKTLDLPPASISAVLVRLAPGSDAGAVSAAIMRAVPGATAAESPRMFQAFRGQIAGLLRGVVVALAATLLVSLALIGLVFSMAAHERRRELGVLRALGATRRFLLLSVVAEAAILAASGGLTGIALAGLATWLYRDLLVRSLQLPFLLPSAWGWAGLAGGGLLLAVCGVTLAALLPAVRVARQEPALAMRG